MGVGSSNKAVTVKLHAAIVCGNTELRTKLKALAMISIEQWVRGLGRLTASDILASSLPCSRPHHTHLTITLANGGTYRENTRPPHQLSLQQLRQD